MIEHPRVAICVPNTGSVRALTMQAIANLCMASLASCDLAVLNGEHSSPSNGRNRLTLSAMNGDYDYFLFVDADMVFPYNALLRLLEHDKDIVGATYMRRAEPYTLLGRWDRTATGVLARAEELPAGFLLVSRSALNRIDKPWWEERYEWFKATEQNPVGYWSEDVVFCQKAKAAGVEIFVDLALTYDMGHIGDQVITCPRQQTVKLAS